MNLIFQSLGDNSIHPLSPLTGQTNNPNNIASFNLSNSANQSGSNLVEGGPIVAVEPNKCLLAPNYTYYLAWGFDDGSLRLGSIFDPLERPRFVFEMIDSCDILCCSSPNMKVIITAGISTVVHVWSVSPLTLC